MPNRKPLWLVAAPAIFLTLWSVGFTVAKMAVAYVEPLTLLALRYALIVALLLPVFAVMRPPLPRNSNQWAHLFIVGYLIQVGYFGLCFMAFKAGVSVGSVAIVVCLQPILVSLIAPRFVGERVTAMHWVGLILALAGAVTVIVSRSAVSVENPYGVIAAVAALFAMTTATLWEKRFGLSYHPITSNLVQYAAGALGTLPIAYATETMHIVWTWQFIAILAYLVVAISFVSITLLLAMIRYGEVSRVSSLFYLVPPLTAIFAWLLIGEPIPPVAWIGMALAAIGVALVSRRPA